VLRARGLSARTPRAGEAETPCTLRPGDTRAQVADGSLGRLGSGSWSPTPASARVRAAEHAPRCGRAVWTTLSRTRSVGDRPSGDRGIGPLANVRLQLLISASCLHPRDYPSEAATCRARKGVAAVKGRPCAEPSPSWRRSWCQRRLLQFGGSVGRQSGRRRGRARRPRRRLPPPARRRAGAHREATRLHTECFCQAVR